MTNSSIVGGEHAAEQAAGRGADALGPSDSSDSGSDVQGARARATPAELDLQGGAITVAKDSDSDMAGTGERASALGDNDDLDADILPDRIVGSSDDALDAPPVDAAVDELVADPRYHENEAGIEDDDEDAATDEAVGEAVAEGPRERSRRSA